MTVTAGQRRGGSWLLDAGDPRTTMTPETITDEHRMIGQTAREFIDQEVEPSLERLEAKDWSRARELVRAAGEVGLLGADVPEAYGGVGLDKVSSVIVGENVATPASFASIFGAQTSLTIMPLLCFGSEGQKQKYLTRLVSGELVGAYALSESGAGSDALGAKARAARQDDGSFVLNGEKMWITNGGFADLFIVFAKIDGEHFTAFIVEREFPGVSSGKEEHKMGLQGSSTTPLSLEEVRVPADCVLGELGKGHKVAFNTLNHGRLKLGAMCSGGGKSAVAEAARYGAERKQFGRAIATFGAIRHKLGEMLVRTYVVESMLYRTAGLIDDWIDGAADPGGAELAALEEFAVECSIAKVAGSEMIDYVLDENVQIHGGNGYVRDYPAERQYRDARVNRIFEGTNEINRLIIPGMLVRRAQKGALPLLQAAEQLNGTDRPSAPDGDRNGGALARQRLAVESFKRLALMVLATAVRTFDTRLSDEQEVLGSIADILIDVYGSECALLRAERASAESPSSAALHVDAASVAIDSAAGRVALASRQALAGMNEAGERERLLDESLRLLVAPPINPIAARRRLADALVARGDYPFAS